MAAAARKMGPTGATPPSVGGLGRYLSAIKRIIWLTWMIAFSTMYQVKEFWESSLNARSLTFFVKA